MDLVDRAMAALRRSVLPSVIARGGTVRVVAVEDGTAILEVRGSPGAVLPLAARIQELLGAAVPEITGVQFVGPTPNRHRQVAATASPTGFAMSWMRRSTR
jgi:Fe-S cluster biogenesis protein NfuA